MSRSVAGLLGLLLAPVLIASEGESVGFHFTKADVGKLPKGWKAARTGKGEGSVWKVAEDPTAPSKSGFVLAQTASGPRALFNLCVAEGGRFKDVEIAIAFKAVKGEEDQGGGVVWRYRDADNYYVARFNPLEDNFRVYRVVGGKREQLGTSEGIKIPAGEWHRIGVSMVGDRIECYLDGKLYLKVKDETFAQPGAVGLWTKADARTYFDDLRVKGVGR